MKDWGPLDSVELLRALTASGADFVVIGGIAAILHGSARVTKDLDICYENSRHNLEALAGALGGLEPRLAGVEEVPFVPDARSLSQTSILCLETAAGRIDLLREPSGFPGYQALRESADLYDLGSFQIHVAAIPHLIAMKLAAGRPQDLVDAQTLEEIQDLRSSS